MKKIIRNKFFLIFVLFIIAIIGFGLLYAYDRIIEIYRDWAIENNYSAILIQDNIEVVVKLTACLLITPIIYVFYKRKHYKACFLKLANFLNKKKSSDLRVIAFRYTLIVNGVLIVIILFSIKILTRLEIGSSMYYTLGISTILLLIISFTSFYFMGSSNYIMKLRPRYINNDMINNDIISLFKTREKYNSLMFLLQANQLEDEFNTNMLFSATIIKKCYDLKQFPEIKTITALKNAITKGKGYLNRPSYSKEKLGDKAYQFSDNLKKGSFDISAT